MTSRDRERIGHATSLAARMQSLAHPGSIVVSEPTFQLTDGYFAFHAVGAAQIKGVSAPVPVYDVLGVGPLRTRLQVMARRGLAQFVGRQRELELLQRAWEQTQRGQGKRAAARELLTPIYGWFTEGFDTADLQEAKGLLEDLA